MELDPSDIQAIKDEASAKGALAQYLAESGHPLLTRDEEITLGRNIQRGDRTAFNELVRNNLRLVIAIAQRYKGIVPLDDGIQEGNIGLMEAAKKFDPERGFRFSTYAIWSIKSHILRSLGTYLAPFGLPQRTLDDMRAVMNAERKLANRSTDGRDPSDEEIARQAKLPLERVRLVRSRFATISMDAGRGDDGDYDLHDRLPSVPSNEAEVPASIRQRDTHRIIQEVLRYFDDTYVPKRHQEKSQKMREILERAYGLNGRTLQTPSEIAAALGLSASQVNGQLRQAIQWIQRHAHRSQ